jgi:hypothetical protein
VRLELIIAVVVNALFGIGVAVLWCHYLGSKAARNPKASTVEGRGHRDKPAGESEFEATWRRNEMKAILPR